MIRLVVIYITDSMYLNQLIHDSPELETSSASDGDEGVQKKSLDDKSRPHKRVSKLFPLKILINTTELTVIIVNKVEKRNCF
jgi:hypothetical protein